MRFDHVGIATDGADDLAAVLTGLLDAPVVHEETLDGLRLVFLGTDGAELELLEPVEDGGTVARFLERRGPGLHHIAFEVDDIAAALRGAAEAGVDRIDEEPRRGARGHAVAFLHPRSTGGVLIELVER